MKKEPIIPLKEKLISFETAKLAKEKGFRNACDWSVNKNDEYIFMPDLLYPNNSEFTYDPEKDPEVIEWEEMMKTLALAPTQSLLNNWLRINYKIHVSVDREEDYWKPVLIDFKSGNKYKTLSNMSESYEFILEVGLWAALKSLKP